MRRLPEVKVYEGWRWPSFAAGADAMRTLAQAGLLPTVLRLSDETETAINLARPTTIGGESTGGCLMITGYEGTAAAVEAKRAAVTALLEGLGGTPVGEGRGRGVGARPLPRAVPARLDARRRRPGRDPGDGDVLVRPSTRSTPP